MSAPQRHNGSARTSFLSFGLVCVLAVGAATAQISAPAQPAPPAQISEPGNTGIDRSGSFERERAACMNGATQQAQDTCLREAANAAADKRKGEIGTAPSPELTANAMRRCEALGGEDHAACTARVLGYGNARGSVAGGGVIREVETVVVPPGQSEVTIVPKTDNPVLVMPAPAK
ncbi:hypothetical protein [Pseudorhodoferax sp. Leaf267]|uniref:hypothetical protein n=1 Tax=Pseudorhodoferax sp. Leaf267 TaxID=1736316 RepID=UPI000714D01F|nr:hypothetical protein [Pseudorhodoferax sp. Leaf267]KQP18382.1 hypothetical protein ASF43_11270 [Pseudorhodoferax sp. Leaf267]